MLLVNASAGNVEVILPPAAGVAGRVYTLKRIDPDPFGTFITLHPYGWDVPLDETIEGSDNMDVSNQYQYAVVQSGGLVDWDFDSVATPTWLVMGGN